MKCPRLLLSIVTLILVLIGHVDAQSTKPGPGPTVESQFQQMDRDKSGTISLIELVTDVPDRDQPLKRREFRLVDFNEDENLSLAEFANMAGVAASPSRKVPDGLQEYVTSVRAKVEAACRKSDGDSDRHLTEAEWKQAAVGNVVSELARIPFAAWDRNGDGKVELNDVPTVLNIAYGLQLPSGELTHTEDGYIFNWSYFRSMDKNGDGKLTLGEFKTFYLGPDESARRFTQLDRDSDGFGTVDEMKSIVRVDPLGSFRLRDRNLDARLDREELSQGLSQRDAAVLPHLIPAFDTNQDGVLSFREFQLSPGAQEVVDWFRIPNDSSGDGRLSREEFQPATGMLAISLSDLFFQNLDRNHDGLLTYNELPFVTDPTRLPREFAFQMADQDQNGQLTYSEIFRWTPAANADAAQRRTYIGRKVRCDTILTRVDLNADGVITLEEFQAGPWGAEAVRVGTIGTQGNIPDPVRELVDDLAIRLSAAIKIHDSNHNARLDATEWATLKWAENLSPLSPSPMAWWDIDRDGEISVDEARQGLRIAFCLERPDGTPLRTDDGAVFNLSYFTSMDANNDGQLSLAEFTERYYLGPEKSAERFKQFDKAGKGTVTFSEVRETVFRTAILDAFLNYDTNFDGLLDPAELLAYRPYLKQVSERLIPAFDGNSDGGLSFEEFRETPLGDEAVSWTYPRNDIDGNGTLSPAEFRPSQHLFASGLSDLFFRRFDLDRSGTLTLSEFPYSTDISNLPMETVFQQSDRDRNGSLSRAEIFRLTLAANADAGARRTFAARKIVFETVLSVADTNHDDELSLQEFQAGPWGVEAIRVGVHGNLRRIPDPIQMVQAQLATAFPNVVKKHDTNRNGRLEATEWSKIEWGTELAPLGPSPFDWWDLDRDGSASIEECLKGLKIAFSLERPDGIPLRSETGLIYNYGYFSSLDANHDGKLTKDEFSAGYYLGKEKSAERFAQFDKSSSGSVTFAEVRETVFTTSVLDLFLSHDTNLDGQLNQAELLSQRQWLRAIEERLLPGFDQNQDGVLSFSEFRATPIADESLGWTYTPNDANKDGILSIAEFRPARELFGSGLSDLFFHRYDLDRSGSLSYDEYPFSTDLARLPRDVVFRKIDLNNDGSLKHDELFRQKLAADANAGAKRWYVARKVVFESVMALADLNRDGELSSEELNSSAWGVEAIRTGVEGTLGRIPDPVADLIAQLDSKLINQFRKSDQDNNGQLNAGEWQQLNWEELSPMAVSPLAYWDANQDGNVTVEECQRGLLVAFGYLRSDGTPLRAENGTNFNVNYFNHLDANHDGRISREEFSVRYHLGPEKSAEKFAQLDPAGKGSVTFAEVRESLFGLSVLDAFLNFDADLDGKVSHEELKAKVNPWLRDWAEHFLPQFDGNGDGMLSFMEFRGTPLSDESFFWGYNANDANRDGTLSILEFRPTKDLTATGLSDSFFRRFDANQNGSLSYDELPFHTDIKHLPREIVFRQNDIDKNGTLSHSEIFRQKPAAEADLGGRRAFIARQLACDAAVARADRNGDRELSVEEFCSSDWGLEAIRAGVQGTPGRIPDPVSELVERLTDKIQQVVTQRDVNRNGTLNVDEWNQIPWAELAPLAPSPFEWWDANQDHELSIDEFLRGVRVAFAQILPDGTPLRTGTGVIYNYNYFNSMDANHDGTLTAEEFKTRFYLGPEKSAARFAEIDSAGKGGVRFPEVQDSLFRISTLDSFLNHDVNLDGQVTRDELIARVSPWLKVWGHQVFPGFDTNRDGVLSLVEFQGTSLADQSSPWNYVPNDADRDGKVTAAELRPGRQLFASGLSDLYFRGFDRNQDGLLSYDEFPFSTDIRKLPRDVVFQLKDQNKDGKLTFVEVFPDQRPDGKNVDQLRGYIYKLTRCNSAFRATDRDSNQELSRAEFREGEFATTSLSDASNGPIPDPIASIIDDALTSLFTTSEQTLSRSEWERIPWEKVAPDFVGLDKEIPDENQDRRISRNEARKTLEIAMGVRLREGFPVRRPTGHLFNLVYFESLDSDDDNKMSRHEFIKGYYSGHDAAAKQFDVADADKNGFLTHDEAASFMIEDRLGTFLSFDQDLNGKITAEELASKARPWEQHVVSILMPAFDLDQDGGLTFEECSLSPLLNRVCDWNGRRRDANNDTVLSFQEFKPGGQLFASALSHRFFRVLDQNHDGNLSYDECPFDMDLSKVPAEIAFKIRDKDRDGKLKFEEMFTELKPSATDAAATERYEMRLGAAETRFIADDTNRDGILNVEEFQQSQESALRAVERKTKALTRHQKKNPTNLPFIAFLILDALVLIGGGWYVIKRMGKR